MIIPIITRIADTIHVHRKLIKTVRTVVEYLSSTIGERSHSSYENMEKAREYISLVMMQNGIKPREEEYFVNDRRYANIIAEKPGRGKLRDEIIVVGAHYDTVEGSCGANDNASGIAGLLELVRVFSHHKNRRTVRFVAFTLEEPPYFDSENMGSMVYAKCCADKKENIVLMISLDMLGYGGMFVKQAFPVDEMKHRYPSTGDFLTVAALPCYSRQAYTVKKIFNHYSKCKMHEFIAPASVGGVNYSDHLSFHKHGYPSIMITDTGVFRNDNYHTEYDTHDTINYRFLATNIVTITHTMCDLSDKREL